MWVWRKRDGWQTFQYTVHAMEHQTESTMPVLVCARSGSGKPFVLSPQTLLDTYHSTISMVIQGSNMGTLLQPSSIFSALGDQR